MNTPLLTRIDLSPIAAPSDSARNAKSSDSAPGKSFTQVLGETRSQSNTSKSANSNSSGGKNAARTESASNSATTNSRSAATAENRSTSSPAPADASQQASNAMGTDARSGKAAVATNNGVDDAAQLAQNAAEAGLAPLVANVAINELAAEMPQAHAANTPIAALGAAAVATALQVEGMPALHDGIAVPQAAAKALADVGVAPTAHFGGVTQPAGNPAVAAVPSLTLNATAAATAASTADTSVNAQAAAAVHGLLDVAGSSPATSRFANLTAASATGSYAEFTEDTPATAFAAPTLPIATDIVDSAAARSLQDFTAMVEAARAASGTTLQPAPAMLTSSFTPSDTLAALMPAGLAGMHSHSNPIAMGQGIGAALGSPQWPTEFGKQFVNIARGTNGVGQVAELRLDPPELGPLRITINLNDNVAHAVFSSPHAAVRQSVENALPQLQQMLEQAGISLGQANVNDQHQAGNPFQGDEGNDSSQHKVATNATGSGTASANDAMTSTHRARPADPDALVDTFA